MASLPYIAVIGGSYVGISVAQQLASKFSGLFKILLIEKNSHFQHLFAFPRFAVTSAVDTHKAFIPYTPGVFMNCPPGSGSVIQAVATSLGQNTIQLDRHITLDNKVVNSITYHSLIIATGTKLTPPSTLPVNSKADGVAYLHDHVRRVQASSSIAVIGGGAVGVQMATDIKEIYPDKAVTLIHSRAHLMNKFHPDFDALIKQRCEELGITLKLGSRVKLPSSGYPTDGSRFDVELLDGTSVNSDFAIICTGQTPQSEIVRSLSDDLVNGDGFIRTKKTLQVDDDRFPNVFAIGDVAATGAHKAAKPGLKQAELVTENIQHLLDNEKLENYDITDPPAIHLSLGVTKNVIFRNPAQGSFEPFIKHRDDGRLDMGIDGVWTRRGGGVNANL